MEQKRFKNIEFLRIIGCLAIILIHLFNDKRLHKLFDDIDLYNKFFMMTCNGQKAEIPVSVEQGGKNIFNR